MAKKATKDELACSFCGKGAHAISKLIAGPGIYICNECITLCNQILADDLSDTPTLKAFDDMETDDLLHKLSGVGTAFASMEASVHDTVTELRQRGVTWAKVGEALRISRQAAWERFSGED